MWRLYALVAVVWLLLMPPLFTAGACTAEFDEASRRVLRDSSRLRTPDAALAYWRERELPVSLISPEACRERKPRFLDRCGSGSLVVAKVPVQNLVCRVYRDDEVLIRLHYDERGRFQRLFADMKPFKSLPIPFSSTAVHWAR